TNAVIIADARRRIEWVNDGFTRLTGYTLDEARGRVPGHFLQFEGTDPATVGALREALRSGASFRGEIKNRGKDGREYWLDLDIQPLRDADGTITRFMAVESDITPLVERGEALKRANAALEEAQSVARMGNWSYDVRTGRVEWSHELYAMFGRDESLGPPDYPTAIAFYDEESAARLDEAVRRAADHGQEYRLDLRTREGVGGVRWVRAHGRVRRDDGGRVTGLFGTAADVTGMVEREEALRESQSLLSTVLDILPQRVFWKDRAGTYLGANSAFLRDAGLGSVVGKTEREMPWGEEQAAFGLACDRRVMDLGEPKLDIEEPQHRADGSTVWVSTCRVPLRDAGGKVVGLLGTYVDITPQREARDAQRQAKELAESASRSKSEFLANMSHELRTPMTAILGYADLLDADDGRELDAGQRAEYVDTIRRNGQHLLAIINDILDLSKIESGKMTIERIETDSLGVIRDVVGLMEVKARAKGLVLRLEQAGSIPERVVSDPVRLRQILVNLIGNAIKFTEVGGVLVRVSLESSYSPILRISVNDTGIGIEGEHRERLFGAFSQADASTTRRFGGTGLGLQISRRLARIMGGDIQVESVPGEGSTFTLTLATELPPGVRMIGPGDGAGPAEAPEHRTDATPGARPLEGVRLLLAEDGPDNQRLIAFHLKRAGAVVSVVETGLGAVRSLCQGGNQGGSLMDPAPVDVVLMDMQMPEMDGYAAARALRSKGCEVPIIALTAHAMAGDRERCLEAGCSGYTTKPINAAEMVALIAEQVGRVRKGVARSGGTSEVEPPRESAMPKAA
ncbi:MAG: PAS domain S-box protein, partial [Phycisphaerales bacterium]|nr:PAS domain S-box protein [Phycisphaerales bacterium]